MNPEPLWHDHWLEALRDTLIGVYGKGWWKKAAAEMYPTGDPVDKGRWLQKALDPERAEKLGDEDYIWIMRKGRENGIHYALFFLTDLLYYTRPTAVQPEDVEADIAATLENIKGDFSRQLDRLEKLRKAKSP